MSPLDAANASHTVRRLQLPGTVALSCLRVGELVEGSSCSGEHTSGERDRWLLAAEPDLHLEVWDTRWSNGERDVVLGREDPVPELPRTIAMLLGRRRGCLQCTPDGRAWMAMRMIRFDDGDWPHFKRSTFDELLERCGQPWVRAMAAHGVVGIGTKAQIFGASDRSRNELCAVFDEIQYPAPVVAFVATRVVPALRDAGYRVG